MSSLKRVLMMTSAAALCSVPMLAFGQQNTGGSSQMPQATQTTPQQGPIGGTPAARGAATTGSDTGIAPGAAGNPGQRTTSGPIPGPTTAQTDVPRSAPDGTPGNPPSTATQRALDSATGTRTDADGTGSNPPGTAAGRAVDRATTPGATTGTTPGTTTGTTTGTTSGTMATGAATPGMSVDSARLQGGRRASRLIGSNVYNENNDTIGEVDDIIVPTAGGQQPVAIISVGGFLGIGARLVAVPYEQLQFNAERNRWTLQGATKDSLQSLPAFTHEDGNRRG